MYQLIFPVIIFLFSTTLISAHNSLDSLMFGYGKKFWSEKEYIFVKGRYCDDFNKGLNQLYEEWQNESHISVKYEDELDLNDLKKHLNFFGPVKSYKFLDKFLPAAVKITENGFQLGPYEYDDSLDAISIISSNGDRRFQLGNSLEGVKSLWTTYQDISQYIVMQDYAITRHGFLNADNYDGEKDYDVIILRKQELKNYETKYYSFYYDPAIFSKGQNIDSLFKYENAKLNNVIKILHFHYPERKIRCYLYKDLEQKYYLSATPGSGNPFPKAYQNHSVGFGPAEHESIHILMGNVSTLFSEGIVGYYYSTVDSLEWRKNMSIISRHPGFSFSDFLKKSDHFDFSQLSYAAAAHFAKYLIDTYGIEKYKSAAQYENINESFMQVYDKSFDEIVTGWENYYKHNNVKQGPEREIIFSVITNNFPDTSSVYITGDDSMLGNWDPASVKLSRQTDSSWTRKFSYPEGTILSYKITRGSWEKEALDVHGNVPQNSVLEVKKDSTIIIRIDKWKDQSVY